MANHVSGRANGGKKSGEPGGNVAVPVTLADRGRGDPRRFLGVIVNRDLETNIYKIAVKAGVLNGGFSRNQLDLCPQNCLLKIKIEKMSVSISLCLCGQRSQRSRHQEGKCLENVTAVVPKNAKQSVANASFKQQYCAVPGAVEAAQLYKQMNQDDSFY